MNKKLMIIMLSSIALLCAAPLVGQYAHALSHIMTDTVISLSEASTPLSPWTVICLFCGLAIFSLPVAPAEMLAGLLFGPFWGTLYLALGGIIAAVMSFTLTRYYFAARAQRYLTQHPGMLQTITKLIEKRGWQAIALLRLTTIIPFSSLSYLLGLTQVRLAEFTWATAIFMIPPMSLYVYAGSLGKELLLNPDHHLLFKILPLIVLGIVITIGTILIKKEYASLDPQ